METLYVQRGSGSITTSHQKRARLEDILDR